MIKWDKTQKDYVCKSWGLLLFFNGVYKNRISRVQSKRSDWFFFFEAIRSWFLKLWVPVLYYLLSHHFLPSRMGMTAHPTRIKSENVCKCPHCFWHEIGNQCIAVVLLYCYKRHKICILVSPSFPTTCVFQDGFQLQTETKKQNKKK